jgi:hypothetical protein
MALTDGLENKINLLAEAITALNTNMFGTMGIRPGAINNPHSTPFGALGSKGISDQGATRAEVIKQTATSALLNRTLNQTDNTLKSLIKEYKKSVSDLAYHSTLSAKLFEEGTKHLSAKEMNEKVPKHLRSMLEPVFGKNSELMQSLTDYQGVINLLTTVSYDNVQEARKYFKAYHDGQSTIEETEKALTDLNFSVETLKEDFNSGGRLLDDRIKKTNTALAQLGTTAGRAAHFSGKFAEAIKVAGVIAYAALGAELDTAKAAMQYGTNFTSGEFLTAASIGMSGPELAKLQHEHIQAIRSSGMGFGGFDSMIRRGAYDMFAYTGSLQEGAKVTANMFDTFRSLSDSTRDQNSFIQQQQLLFEQMNRTVGITGEQFAALNKHILDNSDVQAQMFKVSKEQRLQIQQGLIEGTKVLMTAGLSEQQAERVQDNVQKLLGAGAQTRIQEAAKIQGYGGALGLGPLASQIAQYVRMGQFAPKAKLDADIAQAQRILHQRYLQAGTNLAAQMPLDILSKALAGLGVGSEGAGVALGYSRGKALSASQQASIETSKALGTTNKYLGTALLRLNQLKEVINSGDGKIVKAIADLGVLFGAGKLGNFAIGKIANKGGGWLARFMGGDLGEAAEGAEGIAGAGGAVAEGGLVATVVAAAPEILTALAAAGIVWTMWDLFKKSNIGADVEHWWDDWFHHKKATPKGNVNNDYRKLLADEAKERQLINHPMDAKQAKEAASLAKQIEILRKEFKKSNELLQQTVDQTKKVHHAIKDGNNQSAAHADEQSKHLKKLQIYHDINRQARVPVRT